MSETREFYAATVGEAIEKASSVLGLPAGELSYRVIDEGSGGFLGIGARDARVVVDVPSDMVIPGDVDGSASAEAPASLEISQVLQEDEASSHPEVPEDVLDHVRDLVTSFVRAMGFEARVDVYDAGDYVAVDVASDNTALFIGQKGETIDALQYLVGAAVYRKRPFLKRIVLDAEGYRQRRVEAIQGMAHRAARRAVREGRAVELPPMNASERRVVHLFLKEDPRVNTASEGAGDNRRVKIFPA